MYSDRELIYNSSISNVYKAKDEGGNEICLKCVDIDFKVPPHSIVNEIKVLKTLTHPNVLQYLNHFQVDDDMVLVTPFYKYNLSQLVQSKRYSRKSLNLDLNSTFSVKNMVSESDVQRWLKSMSSGLSYIHQNGIIHRDIKPSNIYFLNDDLSMPVIGDFGICYNQLDPPQDEPLTMKYIDVCTGIYQPPELILGLTDYSFEIDIWCLGIILTMLYSKSLKSCLIDDVDGLDNEGDLSSLALLNRIFMNFGTPTITNADSELYWPELNDKTHFRAFNLNVYERCDYEKLIPKCSDDRMKKLFNRMIKYDRFKRITANELFNELEIGE